MKTKALIFIGTGLLLIVAIIFLNHRNEQIKQQQWIKDSIQTYEDANRASEQYMERLTTPR